MIVDDRPITETTSAPTFVDALTQLPNLRQSDEQLGRYAARDLHPCNARSHSRADLARLVAVLRKNAASLARSDLPGSARCLGISRRGRSKPVGSSRADGTLANKGLQTDNRPPSLREIGRLLLSP